MCLCWSSQGDPVSTCTSSGIHSNKYIASELGSGNSSTLGQIQRPQNYYSSLVRSGVKVFFGSRHFGLPGRRGRRAEGSQASRSLAVYSPDVGTKILNIKRGSCRTIMTIIDTANRDHSCQKYLAATRLKKSSPPWDLIFNFFCYISSFRFCFLFWLKKSKKTSLGSEGFNYEESSRWGGEARTAFNGFKTPNCVELRMTLTLKSQKKKKNMPRWPKMANVVFYDVQYRSERLIW